MLDIFPRARWYCKAIVKPLFSLFLGLNIPLSVLPKGSYRGTFQMEAASVRQGTVLPLCPALRQQTQLGPLCLALVGSTTDLVPCTISS